MKTISIICILMIVVPSCFACNLNRASDWFLSFEQLSKKTEFIFKARSLSVLDVCISDGPPRPLPELGECYVYSFKVLESIKGTYRPGDIIQIKASNNGRNSEKLNYGKDCKLQLGFNIGENYLIYKDRFHPKAFQKIP